MVRLFVGLVTWFAVPVVALASSAVPTNRLRIMSYNVENLFDTVHDAGKNDWEFLPINTPGKKEFCQTEPAPYKRSCLEGNWTDDRLAIKLDQIAKVIEKAGTKPDVLALIEVENAAVVRRLADRVGYKSFEITDSPDARGIDVALVFNETLNLRFLRSSSVTIDLKPFGGKPTRDVLVVEFEYGLKARRKLAVFVNHWPSQGNKSITRQKAAEKVRDLAQSYIRKGYDVVATGDFNVELVNDQPSPFLAFEDPAGGLSILADVDHAVRTSGTTVEGDLSMLSPGTYFYHNEGSKDVAPSLTWNTLDRFFVSRGLLPKIDLKSYRILNEPELTSMVTIRRGPMNGTILKGVPRYYSHEATNPDAAGFSDHFAILVDVLID